MMNNLRKIIIACIAFLVVLLVYLAITTFTGTSDMDSRMNNKSKPSYDANELDSIKPVGSIGVLAPGQITQARYTVRNPDTKQLERVFGFSKLLRQSGDDWDIEQPYLKMFEKTFTCDLTSDSGTVAIEMVGSQPMPKDAQLKGNVIIHIVPEQDSKASQTFIYLDDVIFNSTNSQFSTDGPVRLISEDAEMVGTGMQLIYNSMQGRIEFLRIVDLDFIHIKPSDKSKHAKVEKAQPKIAQDGNGVDSAVSAPSLSAGKPKEQNNVSNPVYRCILSDNVVIKYGKQHVYADEVTLSNINFQNLRSKPAATVDSDSNAINNQEQHNTAAASSATTGSTQPIAVSSDSNENASEVFITCDGGITLRPMEYYNASSVPSQSRTIEFKGQPVNIKQQQSSNDNRTLATCGFLKYDLDLHILDMTSYMDEKYVSLNFEDANASLKTLGSIHWQRLNSTAVVNGPGKLFVNSSDTNGKTPQAELDFIGIMKLYFDRAVQGTSSAINTNVKFIDFIDGITANIMGAKSAKMNADSARIIFGDDNKIEMADLNGNVNVNADDSSLAASQATIYFTKNPNDKKQQIDFIDLLDGLTAKTTGENASDVRADFGRLQFNQSTDLVKAELKGNVVLTSTENRLYAQKAEILFDKDPNGNTYPTSAKTAGTANIISKNSTGDESTFWAKQIDYDLTTGKAIAKGPVKFEFYASPIGDSNNISSAVPVVITARDAAEFDSAKNQIVLKGSVAGKMVENKAGYTEISDFTGDELIVDLITKDKSAATIGHITLKSFGRDSNLTTQRLADTQRLLAVLLTCQQMDYDAINGTITAAGSPNSQIQIDNSHAQTQESAKQKKVTLQRPSYALIKQFDTLKWHLKDNRVEADGDRYRLYASYMPVKADPVTGEMVSAAEPTRFNAGRVEASFTPLPNGKTEISSVSASNGISYEDQKYQFEGGRLFYETGTSFVRINGSKGFNCMLNGAAVDSIEYNLETGKATTELGHTPGMIY
jgi:lipopolysaccharide export system protein LptA